MELHAHGIVALFSGCGGLDLGFELTRKFKVVWANDIYSPSAKTFSQNFGLKITNNPKCEEEDFFLGDVEEADFGYLPFDIDVVTGGPPCQDFSLIRGSEKRKGIFVKRGRLYTHFIRALITLQPKIFVFENVKGLISANRGLAFRQIIDDFRNLNLRWPEMWKNHKGIAQTVKKKNHSESYEILFSSVVDFSKLGVPQQRERIIIIGLRKDLAKALNLSEIKQKINRKLLNAEDVISSFPLTTLETFFGKPLSELENEYKEIMKKYEELKGYISSFRGDQYFTSVWSKYKFEIWHDYLLVNGLPTFIDHKIKERVIKRHEEILAELGYLGKCVEDLILEDESNEILPEKEHVKERMSFIPPGENHEFVKGTKHEVTGLMSNIYRRIHPLKPSPTIIARGGGGTWGYHFLRERQRLTNRERARLQTFPDTFLFSGSHSEIRRQIGEAVPPLASKRIAEVVISVLNNF